jgi:cytochrome c peroxidase
VATRLKRQSKQRPIVDAASVRRDAVASGACAAGRLRSSLQGGIYGELGKKLWFEPRLSMSGIISCNTCHNLSMGGTDNLKTSIGHNWKAGPVNSPTVLNSSLNDRPVLGWPCGRPQGAGRRPDPGRRRDEHAAHARCRHPAVDPGLCGEFKRCIGKDKIDIDMITDSIAEFEKTLVTPNSRFDKWLLGDDKALTEKELAGYTLFKESGCVACHNGAGGGGTSFQRMGVVEPYKSSVAGRRALGGHRRRCRPLQLQGADPAQRRADLSVLPRRRRPPRSSRRWTSWAACSLVAPTARTRSAASSPS